MIEENSKKLYERAIILNAIKFGEFTLSSGQKSSYYLELRQNIFMNISGFIAEA